MTRIARWDSCHMCLSRLEASHLETLSCSNLSRITSYQLGDCFLEGIAVCSGHRLPDVVRSLYRTFNRGALLWASPYISGSSENSIRLLSMDWCVVDGWDQPAMAAVFSETCKVGRQL